MLSFQDVMDSLDADSLEGVMQECYLKAVVRTRVIYSYSYNWPPIIIFITLLNPFSYVLIPSVTQEVKVLDRQNYLSGLESIKNTYHDIVFFIMGISIMLRMIDSNTVHWEKIKFNKTI